jgi:hypothetical protein
LNLFYNMLEYICLELTFKTLIISYLGIIFGQRTNVVMIREN